MNHTPMIDCMWMWYLSVYTNIAKDIIHHMCTPIYTYLLAYSVELAPEHKHMHSLHHHHQLAKRYCSEMMAETRLDWSYLHCSLCGGYLHGICNYESLHDRFLIGG